MKELLLNGHGIRLWVDNAKLHVRDGRFNTTDEPKEHIFPPKKIDIDNIIIYGQNGEISIDAMRWLIKHNVQVTILNWDGKLLTVMLPPESVQVKTKFSQYEAYRGSKNRVHIARKLLEAKFARTQVVLDWLKERYPFVNNDFSKESTLFRKAETIPDMMMSEGRIAGMYWQEFTKIVPPKFEFDARKYQKRPWGAGDTVNCLLNYAYALLEAECLRAINSAGLDVHVGFLHEMNIGKNSLAYDLQEPFRFAVDLAIIKLIENKIMDKQDFIRTENYNLRLRPTGAKKVVAAFEEQMNRRIMYKGKNCTLSNLILIKTRELAQFLVGDIKEIDFASPLIKLARQDKEEIRKKIQSIKYSDWKKLGYSKGTLYYMKQNACSDEPFTLNKHVKERVESWEKIVVKLVNNSS